MRYMFLFKIGVNKREIDVLIDIIFLLFNIMIDKIIFLLFNIMAKIDKILFELVSCGAIALDSRFHSYCISLIKQPISSSLSIEGRCLEYIKIYG